jgi:hypothetical protein
MAGFKMHVTVSSCLGCGYAVGGVFYGFDLDTSILGGALCGFSGMLPDIDSDYGTPLRETMAFTAAVLPMLLVHRFQSLGMKPDEMALIGIGVYLFIRFGLTNMIRKYTVHRGMFHSIPAGLIFAGVAFLVCGGSMDIHVRYFKAGAVFAGFMSHLILDEIYSVEWKGGMWRLKKSSGTAVKLWGDDSWSNFTTYAKLLLVGGIIIGEPSVMQEIEARNPGLAQRYQALQSSYQGWSDRLAQTTGIQPQQAEASLVERAQAWNPFNNPSGQPAPAGSPGVTPSGAPPAQAWPSFPAPQQQPQPANPFGQPPTQLAPPQGNGFDTAQRPLWPGQQ